MYFITIKRMLEVCFLAHPNIQYRAKFYGEENLPICIPQHFSELLCKNVAVFHP